MKKQPENTSLKNTTTLTQKTTAKETQTSSQHRGNFRSSDYWREYWKERNSNSDRTQWDYGDLTEWEERKEREESDVE